MKTIDYSGMIVTYNLVIGVLLMLASDKVGYYAGHVSKPHRATVARFTRLSTLAFGSCVAALSAFIYIAFHILRIGV